RPHRDERAVDLLHFLVGRIEIVLGDLDPRPLGRRRRTWLGGNRRGRHAERRGRICERDEPPANRTEVAHGLIPPCISTLGGPSGCERPRASKPTLARD